MPVNHITRTEINIGARAAPLIARVNRRAKRLILKVDPVTGEIHVTAPSKSALPQAISFAHERIDWIASQLQDQLRGRPFKAGMTIPYQGIDHIIIHDENLRGAVRIDNDFMPAIRVGGRPEHLNRRVADWLKRQARLRLTERSDFYCEQLKRKRGRIQIRDTRTRWGSCSSDGSLSYSWRLILAPTEILDYVAAHECAHLIHLNHSPAFWRIVRGLGVDCRGAAQWLSTEGPTLFTYGVADSAR
ncbi:M48 family metallopeptidase [Hyphococcus lacteus]|uniref:SprT family zinc-dependent metalloprotease n=1 Tax=Hyphococcus lacteus TaxID=3143536 RepID=A0ABV3Z341_9PROT